VAGELLVDTGALVFLLDRSQKRHEAFARFFGEWDRPVVSTEAVLTEATDLLGGLKGGRQACIDFFLSGGALLVPATKGSLRRSRELVNQYADLPGRSHEDWTVANPTPPGITDAAGFAGDPLSSPASEGRLHPISGSGDPMRSSGLPRRGLPISS
jgi:hypothetical protein